MPKAKTETPEVTVEADMRSPFRLRCMLGTDECCSPISCPACRFTPVTRPTPRPLSTLCADTCFRASSSADCRIARRIEQPSARCRVLRTSCRPFSSTFHMTESAGVEPVGLFREPLYSKQMPECPAHSPIHRQRTKEFW